MREKIENYKLLITEEIIKTDIENKKNGNEPLLRMTKVDYLRRLLKLLKTVESND